MGAETTMVVQKELVVERSATDAFHLFTAELARWWPMSSHSIYGDDVVDAVLEPRIDGRIYERTADGRTAEWGRVLEWEPPHRLSISWKPNLDPDAHRTRWSVSFEAIDESRSRLTLVHDGWEGFGDDAEEARAMYTSGWDLVLGRFLAA